MGAYHAGAVGKVAATGPAVGEDQSPPAVGKSGAVGAAVPLFFLPLLNCPLTTGS